MIRRHGSLVVNQSCRILLPFIQIFALYIIGHGHYSPGGGFQGGVLLAAAALLMRLTLGPEISRRLVRPTVAPLIGAAGLFLFAGTGLPALFAQGRAYLDYGWLPFASAAAHAYGILAVEIGVGIGVYAILVSIFDNLIGSGEVE